MSRAKKGLLALMAVVITIGCLWQTNRIVTPVKATWNDVLAEGRNGGYQIISTDDLRARYEKNKAEIRIVDTRQTWEYRTGHIKGASNFPIEPTWLARWRKKGALEKFLGPDKKQFLVFY